MSGLHDKFSRFIEKNPSFLGQRHATLIPQKEGNTKILLELPNLATKRRLGNVQLLRGPAEIEAFRNRDKVSNVTEFHGQLFYTYWVCFQHCFLSAELFQKHRAQRKPELDNDSHAMAVIEWRQCTETLHTA